MANVVEFDCQTNEVVERAFTAEEKAQHSKDVADFKKVDDAQTLKDQTRKDAELRIKERAKTDPDFAALTEVLGLNDPEIEPAKKSGRKSK